LIVGPGVVLREDRRISLRRHGPRLNWWWRRWRPALWRLRFDALILWWRRKHWGLAVDHRRGLRWPDLRRLGLRRLRRRRQHRRWVDVDVLRSRLHRWGLRRRWPRQDGRLWWWRFGEARVVWIVGRDLRRRRDLRRDLVLRLRWQHRRLRRTGLGPTRKRGRGEADRDQRRAGRQPRRLLRAPSPSAHEDNVSRARW